MKLVVRTATKMIASRFVSSALVADAKLQFPAALDHLLNHLVDRVAVFPGPASDAAAKFPANSAQKGRRRRISLVGGITGEQLSQVVVVNAGVIEPIVLAFATVVGTQGAADLATANRSCDDC